MNGESVLISVTIAPGRDESKIEWRDLHATAVGQHFAVHPAIDGAVSGLSWTVTHLPTGRAAARAATKIIALAAAEAFQRTGVDWERASRLAVEQMDPAVRATLKQIQQMAWAGELDSLRRLP